MPPGFCAPSRCQSVLDAHCAASQPECDGAVARSVGGRWGCFRANGTIRCFSRNHQLQLALQLCGATLRAANERRRHDSVTIMVTAAHIASHPSLSVINRTLASLSFLSLARGTPVLLVHDRPPEQASRSDMPSAYRLYLNRLRGYLPAFAGATGFAPKLLVQERHGNLMGSLVLALGHLRTSYVLKLEHDVEFIRHVSLRSVVRDMQREPALLLVRFNHRKNVFQA